MRENLHKVHPQLPLEIWLVIYCREVCPEMQLLLERRLVRQLSRNVPLP
jgi:hypothetical protein